MTTIVINQDCEIYQDEDGNIIINDVVVSVMPITIKNSSSQQVFIIQTTDISDDLYQDGFSIIADGSGDQIAYDGRNFSITISQTNFTGIFDCVTADIFTIKNVNLFGTGTLYPAYNCGWLCCYGFNGDLTNCSVECDSSESQGALCYENLGLIESCRSKIRATVPTFGGICYQNSGQIFSSYTWYFNICVTNSGMITYCYTTSTDIIDNCGGICTLNNLGGNITYCYSVGELSNSSGGICVTNDGDIVNCYTSGSGPVGYGIAVTDNGNILTCYSECDNGSSGWKDNKAEILGTDNWISPGTDQNYLLQQFVGDQYDNVDKNLIVGIPSENASVTGYYSIISQPSNNVSVNVTTGALTSTTAGNISLTVLYSRLISSPPQYYDYGISDFTINVQAACFVKGTQIETNIGDIPIENLHTDHLIKTSQGFNKILNIVHDQIQNSEEEPLVYKFGELYLTHNHCICVDGMLVKISDIGTPVVNNHIYDIYNIVLQPVIYVDNKAVYKNNYIIYANNIPVEAMDFSSYMNRIGQNSIKLDITTLS